MQGSPLSVTINANQVEKNKKQWLKNVIQLPWRILSFLFKGCSVTPKKHKPLASKQTGSPWSKGCKQGKPLHWPPKTLTSCLKSKEYSPEWKKNFQSGHQKGLNSFCKAKRGFLFGLQGGAYKNQCPKNLSSPFIKEYKKGLKVYQFKREIQKIQTKISILKKSLKQSHFSRKSQRENFAKMENLYLKKREVTQYLKRFVESQNITSVKI